MARRYDSADSKRRITSACVRLFIEKGYHDTKMTDILSAADVSSGTFQNIFHTKDGVFEELVHFMFAGQFGAAKNMIHISSEVGVDLQSDPVLLYAVETSIQLTLAELNENLREVYVEAYTQAKIAEMIYRKTAGELYKIFGSYLPGLTESDFYELEIGTAGIMRGYMSRPCDMYFPLKKKLECFLRLALSAYKVPDEKQAQIQKYIADADMTAIANTVMQELFRALAMRFEFTLSDEAFKK